MVMRVAMIQTGLGLLIGVPAAVDCARLVEAQLYEIEGMDAGILAIATPALAVSASIAGMIPARRAAFY